MVAIDSDTQKRILDAVDARSFEMIEAIRSLVRIKSVEDAPAPQAPFGKGVRAALDWALAKSGELGFDTHDIDGYLGYASWGAEEPSGQDDDSYVCALGHLDVVPEGVGWKEPPYSGFLSDGVIYSRGALDNKGPILSCLFAARALRDAGVKPRRELRIMFGCNEETGMHDIPYYLERHTAPIAGFTPDCKYPVVYAERGRAKVRFSFPNGGYERIADFANRYVLNAKPTGETFGIDCADAEFGKLEVRNYRLAGTAEEPALEFAVSYPASVDAETLMRQLGSVADREQATIKLASNWNPVCFDKDGLLCQMLQYAYEQVTDADGTPVTTTGGTYAKVMPNIVPFGPSFPGQKGIGHQPNEWMRVDDLIANAKIYALALYLLVREEIADV